MPTVGRVSSSFVSASIAAVVPALASLLSPSEVNVVQVVSSPSATVTLRVAVHSGSADDPAGKEGLASLTAHLLRREAVDRAAWLAGALHLSVGKDVIVFDAQTSRENADRTFEAIETMLLKPMFDQAKLEMERAEQERALRAIISDPDAMAREAFDAFVFRGHPYAHPVAGRFSSLEKITREDVTAFHAAHWLKGSVAIGLTGDASEATAAQIRQDLSALPDGEPAPTARPISWLPRPRVVVVEEAGAGRAVIRMGHPLNVARAHPDFLALRLAAASLAGQAAPMDVSIEMADPHEDTDSAAGAPLPRHQQAFVMAAALPPAEAPSIIRLALDRINDASRAEIDGARLEQIRLSAASQLSTSPDDPAAALAERMDELFWRTPGFAERFRPGLAAVTAQDVRGAISNAVHPDRTAIVAVVPGAKEFVDGLLSSLAGRESLTKDDIEIVTPESLVR